MKANDDMINRTYSPLHPTLSIAWVSDWHLDPVMRGVQTETKELTSDNFSVPQMRYSILASMRKVYRHAMMTVIMTKWDTYLRHHPVRSQDN